MLSCWRRWKGFIVVVGAVMQQTPIRSRGGNKPVGMDQDQLTTFVRAFFSQRMPGVGEMERLAVLARSRNRGNRHGRQSQVLMLG